MTHASVFSGIGGPEVAATMLGWENLFHCEINPFGRAVLDYWYPKSKSYNDITKTDFSEWRGKVDVLTGGFPCQPFSYAGQRRGAEDDRYLWPYMFKCIDTIRPTWVVAENVGGILTMVEQGEVFGVETQGALFGEEDVVRRYELRETFTLERICDDLETHGYAVQPVLVPACAVGAPHRRDRVFIVGRRRDDGRNGNTAERKASYTANAESAGGRCLCEHPRSEQPNGTTERMSSDTDRPCGLDAPTDTDSEGRSRRSAPDRRECEADRGEGLSAVQREFERPRSGDAAAHAVGGGEGAPGEGGSVEGNGGNQDKQPCQRRAASEWNSRFYELLRDAADTADHGLQHGTFARSEGSETGTLQGQRHSAERNVPTAANGDRGSAADTTNKRQGRIFDTSSKSQLFRTLQGEGGCSELHIPVETTSSGRETTNARWGDIAGCGRWRDFPTVSPVHRGNDGLPFPLDDLTLSPAKWRTEALKAYGNAIVPQVMYEIFRAIEIAEKNKFLLFNKPTF